MCHSSPGVSDGGVDEPRQNSAHNDSNRRKKCAQKLGLRRSPMVGNAGGLVYHSVAKLRFAVLIVGTISKSTRPQSSTGRRHNEKFVRWNNLVRNLASRNAGRMILIDLEHELRALDQSRFTTRPG